MANEDDSGEGPGEWCSINEAARRLRVDPKTVRDWLAAVPPKLRERSRGNRGREVWITDDERRDLPDHSEGTPESVELRVQVARLEERLAASERREADERQHSASLMALLAEERARVDKLQADHRTAVAELRAELAEARRPWLARVLEGLRRKGS